MKENPNYYSVIPASVRYDQRLKANTKLLYSEITALSNKSGKCWASNNYFAALYGVNRRSIIDWINQLKDYGYIKVHYVYEEGKKEVKERLITLTEVVKIPSLGGEKIITTWGKKDHEVVNKSSRGSEENFTDNTIHNNKEEILNFNNPVSDFEKNESFSEIEKITVQNNSNLQSDNNMTDNIKEIIKHLNEETIIKFNQLDTISQEELINKFNLEYDEELQLKIYLKSYSKKINKVAPTILSNQEPKSVQVDIPQCDNSALSDESSAPNRQVQDTYDMFETIDRF